MIPVSVFGKPFIVLYSMSGISDILDGFVARKLHIESEIGARLDSISDILLVTVVSVKVFPVLLQYLNKLMWTAVFVIAMIRISAYIIGFVKYGHPCFLHTYLNKLSGLLLFVGVYFIKPGKYFYIMFAVVCIICAISSIEELVIECISKEYKPDIKSIFRNQM